MRPTSAARSMAPFSTGGSPSWNRTPAWSISTAGWARWRGGAAAFGRGRGAPGAGAGGGGVPGATTARLAGRHRGVGGKALRAGVLGANDDLVSDMSLVM